MALNACGKKSLSGLGSYASRNSLITGVDRNLSSKILHNSFNSLMTGGDRNMSNKVLHNSNNEKFSTLNVTTPVPFVYNVELNRPKNLNTFNHDMWIDIKQCFEKISTNPECRVVVLSGAGKHFTGGLDLGDAMKLSQDLGVTEDVARRGILLERTIKLYQDSISSLEVCPKPVITAVHGGCIGAGVNLITAADIRYCSEDAFFSVKEADIGMAADVGALQRLPKVVGSESLARELCYTARRFGAAEAHSFGMVSKVFSTKEACLEGALKLAESIAQKSPVAIQATKKNIVYSQSKSNQEGLDHIREINKLNLQSEDFANAAVSALSKELPKFSKL